MKILLERLERLTERKKTKPSQRRKAKAKRKKRRKDPSLVAENEAVTKLSELVNAKERDLDIFLSGLMSADGRLELDDYESDSSSGEMIIILYGRASDEGEIEDAGLSVRDQKPTEVAATATLTAYPESRGKIELSLNYDAEVDQVGDGDVELTNRSFARSIDVPTKDVAKVKNLSQLKRLFKPLLNAFGGPGETIFQDWESWAEENDTQRAQDWANHLRYD